MRSGFRATRSLRLQPGDLPIDRREILTDATVSWHLLSVLRRCVPPGPFELCPGIMEVVEPADGGFLCLNIGRLLFQSF